MSIKRTKNNKKRKIKKFLLKKKLEFTPCKADYPLRGTDLQEKQEVKEKRKQQKLFRKNL